MPRSTRGCGPGGGGCSPCRSSRRPAGAGRRARPAPRACSEASGRGSGRTASAKWAMSAASSRSVLASRPVARPKARTWAGLTTASGRPAAARAAATPCSKPPVASSTTSAGRERRAAAAASVSRPGAVARNREGLARGAEMDVEAILGDVDADEHAPSRPGGVPARACRCGLAARRRPKRPSGLPDAVMAGGAPHSAAGSITPAVLGLPPATSLAPSRGLRQ